MPQWRLTCGQSVGYSQSYNTTLYILPCSSIDARASTESWVQCLARDSYTLKNLFVRVGSNTLNNSTTVRTRKNGANGNQSVSIGAGATGTFEDTSNTDSLVSGNLFNYQSVTGGTSGSVGLYIFSLILQTSSNNTPILGTSSPTGANIGANITVYCPIGGYGGATSDTGESRVQYTFRVNATLSNLRIYVNANAFSGSSTFRTRKNGANGNQSVSIPALTSGAFEDTTNTDSIASGDSFNYQFVTGSGSGVIQVWIAHLKSTSTGRQNVNATNVTGTISYGYTGYFVIEARGLQFTTTESRVQLTMRLSATIKNLFVRIPSNSIDNSSTFRTRKNGSNGNLSVSVPASTTGTFEDTTNSDDLTATDNYNYQIVTGGTSGSIGITIVGVELQQAVVAGQPMMQRYFGIPTHPGFRGRWN